MRLAVVGFAVVASALACNRSNDGGETSKGDDPKPLAKYKDDPTLGPNCNGLGRVVANECDSAKGLKATVCAEAKRSLAALVTRPEIERRELAEEFACAAVTQQIQTADQ